MDDRSHYNSQRAEIRRLRDDNDKLARRAHLLEMELEAAKNEIDRLYRELDKFVGGFEIIAVPETRAYVDTMTMDEVIRWEFPRPYQLTRPHHFLRQPLDPRTRKRLRSRMMRAWARHAGQMFDHGLDTLQGMRVR